MVKLVDPPLKKWWPRTSRVEKSISPLCNGFFRIFPTSDFARGIRFYHVYWVNFLTVSRSKIRSIMFDKIYFDELPDELIIELTWSFNFIIFIGILRVELPDWSKQISPFDPYKIPSSNANHPTKKKFAFATPKRPTKTQILRLSASHKKNVVYTSCGNLRAPPNPSPRK